MCALKTISKCTAGTDADCSYMNKDSQFNMIVYVRKNNYMEGSGSATIK